MWKSAGRAPSKNASFTLAFALQLRKKHGKTSVREKPQFEFIFHHFALTLLISPTEAIVKYFNPSRVQRFSTEPLWHVHIIKS
jgi:hypothetical protein